MSELEDFRRQKDEFFRTGAESPIPEGERGAFSGLRYYPENPGLKFLVPLERTPEQGFEFETSTGEKRNYQRIGILKFAVDGQPAQLALFQAESGDYFLPFRDATSGKETYGAGRYLEVGEKEGKFELDFNYAYNPYCAYAAHYSCPLPPAENWLKVPIEAGEKKHHA